MCQLPSSPKAFSSFLHFAQSSTHAFLHVTNTFILGNLKLWTIGLLFFNCRERFLISVADVTHVFYVVFFHWLPKNITRCPGLPSYHASHISHSVQNDDFTATSSTFPVSNVRWPAKKIWQIHQTTKSDESWISYTQHSHCKHEARTYFVRFWG